MIVPGGKTYSNTQSGLSHREASGIVIGREGENDIQEFGRKGMGWIELAQTKDRWWVLVNAVMYVGFYVQLGIS